MNRFFKCLGILAFMIDIAFAIKNDPNDLADEAGNPRYILDLLLSFVNVSVQTVDIVAGFLGLDFGE